MILIIFPKDIIINCKRSVKTTKSKRQNNKISIKITKKKMSKKQIADYLFFVFLNCDGVIAIFF